MTSRPTSAAKSTAAKAPARAPIKSGGASARAGSAPKTRPASGAAASSSAAKGKGSTALGAIGAYTKLQAIGKGSFGQIWLVKHTQKGGEAVVLKEVHLKKLSPNEVKAAKLELEVLQKMKHEHIIGFVNTFEVEGITGLLMEYAPAGDLATAITKRIKNAKTRFPESEVTTFCVQLASALGYMHDTLQLVHRDVKPANIFMCPNGDVKLGDFGLCAYLKNGSIAGEPVRTTQASHTEALSLAHAPTVKTSSALAELPPPRPAHPPRSLLDAGGYTNLHGTRAARGQGV